jgi:hypothetical protein
MKHEESCTDGIFTIWYDPEVFSFSSLDPFGYISDDPERVLRIGIIIREDDDIC